jgi:diphosphomevalonate decarboxylase
MVTSNSNLALLKYLGVDENRSPLRSSVAIKLNQLHVEIDLRPNADENVCEISLDGDVDIQRVSDFCERIRFVFGLTGGFELFSKSNFPIAFGFAGSAAGFSAICLAFSRVYNLDINDKRFYDLLAFESGSALRSLFGFDCSFWDVNKREVVSLPYLAKFPIAVCSVLPVNSFKKEVSSFALHELASLSPLMSDRIDVFEKRYSALIKALENNDWRLFQEVVESDALGMLAQMWSLDSPQKLVSIDTLNLWTKVKSWALRNSLNVALTFDAGPALHVLFEPSNSDLIMNELSNWSEIEKIFLSRI